jgi:hypothetical protein
MVETICETFYPSSDGPVLLIVDGDSSHKDIKVVNFVGNNNVYMPSTLPYTTLRIKALDRPARIPFRRT